MDLSTAASYTIDSLIDGWDFLAIPDLINDLDASQATFRPANSPHAIADLVWHLSFWLDRWQRAVAGEKLKPVTHPQDDFRSVPAGEWHSVRDACVKALTQLTALKSLSNDELVREVRKNAPVQRYIIAMVVHSSYHAGQIALIRQLIVLWPPAANPDEVWTPPEN